MVILGTQYKMILTRPPEKWWTLQYKIKLYRFFLLQEEDAESNQLWNKLCTFTTTRKEFANQHWYHCHTCRMNDGVGVCTICAIVCHKNHDVTYAKYGSFFCDCGAKEDDSCKVGNDCLSCT